MPLKRRKLLRTTSASSDASSSSNHSIVSMFARHHSHDSVQNMYFDNQHVSSQTAHFPEVTDKPRLDNRLSLSLRRKRVCTTDAAIDLTDDADNNNTAEPCCMVFPSTDTMADATTDVQNDLQSEASLLPSDSYQDAVSLDTSDFIDQQIRTNFTVSEVSSCQNDSSIFVENSTSDPSPEMQTAVDTEVVYHVPYYLENFLRAMNSIFSDTFYAELFNSDDLSAWNTFRSLNGNSFSDIFRFRFISVVARRPRRIEYITRRLMQTNTRSSAIAEGLRNAICQLKSCQLQHNAL